MPHSWENHKEPRYALPIPFAPGSHNVTDAYRANYDAVFGHRCNVLCERPCPDARVTREQAGP